MGTIARRWSLLPNRATGGWRASNPVPSRHRRARAGNSTRGRHRAMKLILHINDFNWQVAPDRVGPTLAEIARVGEAAGFARIGVADHLWQAPQAGGPEVPELECYTTMAFLAAHTSRV